MGVHRIRQQRAVPFDLQPGVRYRGCGLAPRSTRRRPRAGLLVFSEALPCLLSHLTRTIAFVDGQNLFHAAKEAFGYPYPDYDARALADAVCRFQGWSLTEVRSPGQDSSQCIQRSGGRPFQDAPGFGFDDTTYSHVT